MTQEKQQQQQHTGGWNHREMAKAAGSRWPITQQQQ